MRLQVGAYLLGEPMGLVAGPSDPALLAAVGRGDRAALGALYDRHAPLAFGLALRITGDRAHAEAALVAGFVAAWRCAPAARAGECPPGLWLLGAVCREARRSRSAARARPSPRRSGRAGPAATPGARRSAGSGSPGRPPCGRAPTGGRRNSRRDAR
jgi:RNA polymerase sigma-70 factor (ECF subfamily)